jgi:3-phosphoshikimate 1-carboxyvinyltransferase
MPDIRATDYLDLAPVTRMTGTVRLPGSKSISNRTLLLAALARGTTEIRGLLDADDVDRMLEALATLGVPISQHVGTRDFEVRGAAGAFPVRKAALSLGNAGTALRPLTAVLALTGGDYELSGTRRMHERPIGDLVDTLRALGAEIRYLGREGYPPLAIGPGKIRAGGAVSISGRVSSQFTSALLMALPLTAGGATVEIADQLISAPYVEMTLNLITRFGVTVEREHERRFRIAPGASYASPGLIHVEGDASSASYFLAAGAIGGGPIRVEGVGRASIQGDIAFATTLEQMGASLQWSADAIEVRCNRRLAAIDADFNRMPDAAMTTELRKLGATVQEGSDWLAITPPPRLLPATIDTYDDHRIAMCFSLARLGGVTIRINDPDCVRKTFPRYFAELQKLAG